MRNVYCIIVIYYPNFKELESLINRIKKECKKIVICNNSSFFLELKDKQIKIFNFLNNIGIAAAQNTGMEYSFKNGADFVVFFDQDTLPQKNLIDNLLKCYKEDVGIITSLDYDRDTKEINYKRFKKGKQLFNNCFLITESLSSGSLISKKLYYTIGGMNEELFIDLVDFEYCWRAVYNGFEVLRNNEAVIYHRNGNGEKDILGFKIKISAPIRNYYQIRNYLLILRYPYVPLSKKVSFLIRAVIKTLFYPIIFRDGRLKYILRGFIDGIKGKTGKYEEKSGFFNLCKQK
jgi:rhamnosyltransferase